MTIDPQDFRLPGEHPLPKPQPRSRGRFLKGPIPWVWLALAMSLPGKAPICVALWLWFRAGMRRQRSVEFNPGRVELARTTARRGLDALEQAGLVAVVRGVGRIPHVTILDVEGDE